MKQRLKQLLRRFGLDLVPYRPTAVARAQAIDPKQKGANLLKALTCHEIDLIFDVGANTGQFAQHLFEIGYEGRIVSFEPAAAAYEQLLSNSQPLPNWEIAARCALGDRTGKTDIRIAKDPKKSSILPALSIYLEVSANAAQIDTETVPMVTFADCYPQYRGNAKAPLLKINVQGFEDRVLAGAAAILPQLRGLHIEFSFVPLYEQQRLFDPLFQQIQALGFTLYNLYPSFSDYRTGKILKAIGIFFREQEENR